MKKTIMVPVKRNELKSKKLRSEGRVKYRIDWVNVDVTEDDYEKGAIGNNIGHGDYANMQGKQFDSVKQLCAAVANAYIFDLKLSDWYFMEEDGIFGTSFLVDEDNVQVTDKEIKLWEKGEYRLWICDVTLKVSVAMIRDIADSDIPSEIKFN